MLFPTATLFSLLFTLPFAHSLYATVEDTNTTTTTPTTPSNGLGSTPSQRHYITADTAHSLVIAAAANASAIAVPENICVVDPSGILVAFLRMDNAYIGSIDIAQKKAKTVALFNGMPSGSFYSQAQPGAPLYGIEETNGGLVVFGGGLPIYVDGYLIGAVGVSGGTVAQDLEVATAGLEAIGASASI